MQATKKQFEGDNLYYRFYDAPKMSRKLCEKENISKRPTGIENQIKVKNLQ